jgi:hypothetical protein
MLKSVSINATLVNGGEIATNLKTVLQAFTLNSPLSNLL